MTPFKKYYENAALIIRCSVGDQCPLSVSISRNWEKLKSRAFRADACRRVATRIPLSLETTFSTVNSLIVASLYHSLQFPTLSRLRASTEANRRLEHSLKRSIPSLMVRWRWCRKKQTRSSFSLIFCIGKWVSLSVTKRSRAWKLFNVRCLQMPMRRCN